MIQNSKDADNLLPEDVAKEEEEAGKSKGPLAWFARNSVAANVLMIILLVGGLVNMRSIKQEVFPSFDLDIVVVQMMYPGAGPEEVERGAILVVEEAVRGMDGVKEVNSTAREGMGVVSVTLKQGEDAQQRLADIKAEVDRITSFPQDLERPNVFLPAAKWEVISLVIHGDHTERALREVAEKTRDKLLQDPRVSMVDLGGAREYEISVEVPQENLRRYGLTLEQIAKRIRAAAVELPGGGVKTDKGEVLIRTTERRLVGSEFEEIVLIAKPDGTTVTIGDVATVKDSFKDTDETSAFNGERAIMMRVYRVGDEKPTDVSDAVSELAASANLPEGMSMSTWMDMSLMYRQRMSLLTRNALFGLVLVILVLGLFLDIKLAFWVTMGIPISFAGAFLLLPATDMSVNMISMFAFIQVLGMVVDDAIVVGEAAYLRRQQGMKPLEAAIAGVKEVAVPVCFAVITTIVMYIPMLMMPGVMGKFMGVIPVVVITVLLLSLIESLLILPAHLAHSKASGRRGVFAWIGRKQETFSRAFDRFVLNYYMPAIRKIVSRRYLAMSVALSVLIGSCGLLAGGRIRRIDMPEIDSDVVVVAARLPYGTSLERSLEVEKSIVAAANRIVAENPALDGSSLAVGQYAQVGRHGMTAKQDMTGASAFNTGPHLVESAIYMVPAADRPVRAREVARMWREALADVVGIESLTFNYAMGPGSGASIHLNLSHDNYETLQVAAADLAKRLEGFEGTYDIKDGYEEGKEQIDFELSPRARSLGITEGELAQQLRSAFFGAEAVRQQRGRDEVRTYVRLPKEERESEYNIEEFLIRTPTGGEIPVKEAAIMTRGNAYTQISRNDGLRVLSVTAMVDPDIADPKKVHGDVVKNLMPELLKEYPGLSFRVGGPDKEMAEAMGGLMTGFLLALIGVFALLAVAFRSYMQPLLIMFAIPFGAVGALWGHYALGYDFSMMSMMGIVALSGIVVNDSLILIVAINDNRAKGMSIIESIAVGGQRRFRPILLTSLTTFFGLMPMLLETEAQAQFLIPMAISLGFGVMAATFITLLIVPVCYAILNDAKGSAHKVGELTGFLEERLKSSSAGVEAIDADTKQSNDESPRDGSHDPI